MKATIIPPNIKTMNSSEQVASLTPVPPSLIKKKELSKRLSVSPRTIDAWVAKRVIPHFKITPRFHLFEFEAVLAALKKNYQVAARS